MAYITQDDILVKITLDDLISLTDDTGDNIVDTTILSSIINDVDIYINQMVNKYFDVPFTTAPDIVKYHAVNLCIYGLYYRRDPGQIPEAVILRYDETLLFFENVKTGKNSIYGATDKTVSAPIIEVTDVTTYMDEDSLEGFDG